MFVITSLLLLVLSYTVSPIDAFILEKISQQQVGRSVSERRNNNRRADGLSSLTDNEETPTTSTTKTSVDSVEDATKILSDWDKEYNSLFNNNNAATTTTDSNNEPILIDVSGNIMSDGKKNTKKVDNNIKEKYPLLIEAVKYLTNLGNTERDEDSTKGRIMLGICASSTEEGINTLKSWVTNLGLPRGLLHGMDVDGIPVEIEGGVYIKYNTGGCLSFSEIRKSQMGFDALWKPGDALLEPYDGDYRGVYYQVELSTDDEFRQYLVPLDIFGF